MKRLSTRLLQFTVLQLICLALFLSGKASAQSSLTVAAKGVYGIYENSLVDVFRSGRGDIYYNNRAKTWWLALGWRHTDITVDKTDGEPARSDHLRVSLARTFYTRHRGSFTLALEGSALWAPFPAVDQTFPGYLSLSWFSPAGRYYADLNLHYFPNDLADKAEVSATWGMALFNYYVWAQASGHFSFYEQPVQNIKWGWSVHPELTWYPVPRKLTLTAYGIFGEQVLSYNPSTLVLYTTDVMLTVNLGLTAYYQLGKHLKPYADVQYERYDDQGFQFSAVYYTFGLFYKF